DPPHVLPGPDVPLERQALHVRDHVAVGRPAPHGPISRTARIRCKEPRPPAARHNCGDKHEPQGAGRARLSFQKLTPMRTPNVRGGRAVNSLKNVVGENQPAWLTAVRPSDDSHASVT